MKSAQLIVTKHSLSEVVQKLQCESIIGVDTEGNSLYSYQERVCLIQISTSTEDFIIDPFAIDDLTELQTVLENNEIEKVLHASEYDLFGLWRDFGWRIEGLFDTMIAARSLGWKNLSLASILLNQYSIRIDKKFQLADWAKRPLTEDQLLYAQLDTHYLLSIRDVMVNQIIERDQWFEVYEEFDRVARVSRRNPHKKSINDFWKITGAQKLRGKNSAVLLELYKYRDKIAVKLDVPPFRIVRDHILIEISLQCPQNKQQLEYVKGMNPRLIRLHHQGILKAVRAGIVAEHPVKPQKKKIDPLIRDRYQSLKMWRKNVATKRGVSSDVIIAREVLWNLAVFNPIDYSQLELVEDLGSWRRKTYGKDILQVLQNGL